jgi:hypothetical protein
MAKFSFSSTFLKEVLMIFRERPLKEIIFGKKVSLASHEEELLNRAKENNIDGVRKGELVKINLAHKGEGTVYLAPDGNRTVLLFDTNVKIIPGPDLYVYLSPSQDPKNGLGEFLNLGLLKGTKGGQTYQINMHYDKLGLYKTVVIHCKQFDVLFSYALLN